MGKKRRDPNKASKTNVTRNKIKAIKREMKYAGGSRLDWLQQRLQYWEGKS